MYKLLTLSVLVIVAILLTSPYVSAVTFTQRDNEAKQEIFSGLTDSVNNTFSKYKNVTAGTHDNKIIVIYNQSEAPPPVVEPPKPTDNQTIPPIDNQTIPPVVNDTGNNTTEPLPQPDKPSTNFDKSVWLRVGTIGDIDDNSGLVTQINLFKKYNIQLLVIVGDYGYKSCPAVIKKLNDAGFNSDNAVIVQGNHDCSADTKKFNGVDTLYYNTNFPNIDGKLSVFAIDGNSNMGCSSTQFKAMKDRLESSDAWYDIPAIHQPFVTVDTDHPANGEFTCYDPLFRANGVKLVLQAHNHNYQRIDVNGIDYLTVGTGTHDQGSKMYPIESDEWNGFPCLKCIDDTNGITILDFRIDDPDQKQMHGWFISNSDSVKDSFNR